MSNSIDVIENLAKRAKKIYDDGDKWIRDAVEQAIDDELIYTEDILALIDKYIPASKIADLFFANCYDNLVNDVRIRTKELIKEDK